MQQTLQGTTGPITISPLSEADPEAAPRFFMDEWEAEEFLRQFQFSNSAMEKLRLLLEDVEQANMGLLTDEEVLVRMASHLAFGALAVVGADAWEAGAGAGGGGGDAAGGGGGAGFITFSEVAWGWMGGDAAGGGGGAGARDGAVAGAGGGGGDAAGGGGGAAAAGGGVAAAAKAAEKKKKILIDIVIQLQYWNPVTGKVQAFPAGAEVNQMNGGSVIERKKTDDKGVCVFSEREYTSEKPSFIVDLLFNEYIDLDKNKLVSGADVKPGDKRRLIRMPRTWDSSKEKKFLDNRGGRFSTGTLTSVSKGQQGSKGSPWKIQLDIGWDKVWAAFTFYNPGSKKEEGICYGGLLEAFSDSGLSSQVAGGTVIDKTKGLCYLGVWSKTSLDKLHLKLRCPADGYIDLSKDKGSREMIAVASAAYAALSGKKKREHYPLPAEWRSKKQYAYSGSKRKNYEDQIKKKTSKGKPISFNLDDFVLVSAGGSPVAWSATNRFSIFTNLMRIRSPDSKEPYLTKHKRSSNHFAASTYYYRKGKDSDHCTRAVAFNRGLYDLTNKRTTSGDIIGARAAVLGDHPEDDKREFFCSGAGNYTIHYFHDCAEVGGEPLSHLLVHWTCLFRKHPTAAKSDTVTNGTLRKYKKTGLTLAKIRHEGRHPMSTGRSASKHKDYRLLPKRPGASPKRMIKVCVFLEARPAAPVHCTVNVQNDGQRDSMGLYQGSFSRKNTKPNNSNKGTDRADNLTFPWFTLAHEVGHALGLDDEYLEPITDASGVPEWDTPILPEYSQYYPGMPFSAESGIALMESNKALRMRHFWQHCRWVNEDAAIQTLVGRQRYQLEYPMRTGATLRFHLRNRHKDIYKPFKDDVPYSRAGTTGKMNLYLYKLGEDEMQRYNIKAGVKGFDSILVVNHRLHYTWPANHNGDDYSAYADQLWNMQALQDEVDCWIGRNGFTMFGLECPTGDFKKCMIYFRPYYSRSGAAPAGTHFTFNLRPHDWDGTDAQNAQEVEKEGFNSTTIKLTDGVHWATVLRYMLGAAPISVAGAGAAKVITPLTDLKKSDLNFLGNWVKTKLGAGVFTVKKY